MHARPPATRLWLALVAGALAGCTGAEAQQAGPPASTGNLHGAATSAAQLERLAALAPADPSSPPPGVDPRVWLASIPADNAPSAARLALGQKLYFDTRLSADNTVSCATCHDSTRSFTDLRMVSEGIGGKLGRRSAPTTMNAALLPSQFWDGRAATVDDQAKLPIVNPIEMGMADGDAAVAAIAGDAEYVKLFQDAYGRAPNYDDIGRAIGTFERSLIFLDAPLDRFLAGDAAALSAAAQRGWALYNGQGRCVTCHPLNAASPIGTDGRFHNIGVAARTKDFPALARAALAALAKEDSMHAIEQLALNSDSSELGRFLISRQYADIGGFRTPQVRNVGITAPYMHDGSQQTLWDVIDHYNKGGEPNRWLDGGIEPLGLTEPQIDDLVALLFALTDRRFATENQAEEQRQRELSRKQRPLRDDDVASRRTVRFGAK